MNIEKISSWLQVTANIGILGGLILVGLQLQQNSEILQAQMMSAESQSLIGQEMQIIGEHGATAWVAAMSDPTNVTAEQHRIMEAIFWSAVESWRHVEQLDKLGLAEVDARGRVQDEAPWYFGNTYGQAWWITRRDGSGLSSELKQVVDEAIKTSPTFTGDLHKKLVEEIRRLSAEH